MIIIFKILMMPASDSWILEVLFDDENRQMRDEVEEHLLFATCGINIHDKQDIFSQTTIKSLKPFHKNEGVIHAFEFVRYLQL